MRLAIVGAFPFPHVQGSQVFARDQTRALRDAGADCTLFCYGRGLGDAASELPDVPVVRTPRALSPRSLRAGPSPRKPLADAALAAALGRAHARAPFDTALAHNAEAALAALAIRPLARLPLVYVAHTLLAHELSAYAHPRWRRRLDALGRRIDLFVARRADAVAALCDEARDALAPACPGPTAVIPPGLVVRRPPDAAARCAACARHGLTPGRFALYTGNLDAYQELPLLAEAARSLPSLPVVVATHDPAAERLGRLGGLGAGAPALRVVRVRDPEEVRALCAAAAALVATRRRPGGFPVKLLNYMEAARPIVAFAGAAPGLRDGREAVILPRAAGGAALASALAGLGREPDRAARLGAAARAHLEARHEPARLAGELLALVRRAIARRGARPG